MTIEFDQIQIMHLKYEIKTPEECIVIKLILFAFNLVVIVCVLCKIKEPDFMLMIIIV